MELILNACLLYYTYSVSTKRQSLMKASHGVGEHETGQDLMGRRRDNEPDGIIMAKHAKVDAWPGSIGGLYYWCRKLVV